MSEQRHTTNEVGDGAENTAAGRNPDGTPCECQRPSGGRCPPWCRHERHEVRDLTDRLCDASVDDRDVSTSDIFRALGYEVRSTKRGPYKRGLDSPRWTSLSRPLWSLEDARRLVDSHAPWLTVELAWSPGGEATCRVSGPALERRSFLAPTPHRALVATLLVALELNS
jgi:hypothetical protein